MKSAGSSHWRLAGVWHFWKLGPLSDSWTQGVSGRAGTDTMEGKLGFSPCGSPAVPEGCRERTAYLLCGNAAWGLLPPAPPPAKTRVLKNADSLVSERKKTSNRSEFTAQKYRNDSPGCCHTQAVDFRLHFCSVFIGQSAWGWSCYSGYQEELKPPVAGEATDGSG